MAAGGAAYDTLTRARATARATAPALMLALSTAAVALSSFGTRLGRLGDVGRGSIAARQAGSAVGCVRSPFSPYAIGQLPSSPQIRSSSSSMVGGEDRYYSKGLGPTTGGQRARRIGDLVGRAAVVKKKDKGIVKKNQPYADEIRQGFVNWLNKNGLPDQNVELRYVGMAGWGLVAKKPLRRGDVAFEIPEDLLITRKKVFKDSKFSALMQEKKFPDYWLLAMFLVEQYALTQENPAQCDYAPYIKSLPDETGNVIEWSGREIGELLKGSPMERVAYMMVSDVREAVQLILKEVKGHPNAYYMSEARLRWAFALLLSRVVRLTSRNRELALIPWADMANHRTDVETFIDFEQNKDSVVFRTDREYKEGDEVFVSYGPRSSGDLLLTYGFVPSTASSPQIEKVDLRLVLDGYDPFAGPKKQALKKYGLDSTWTFPLQLNQYPSGLMEYAAFLAFRPKSDAEVEFYAQQLFGKTNMRVIPGELDTPGRDLIKQECFNALSRYRGSVESDRLMLEEKEVISEDSIMSQERDKRALAAAAVRLRERAILRKTRDIIDKGVGNFVERILRNNPIRWWFTE